MSLALMTDLTRAAHLILEATTLRPSWATVQQRAELELLAADYVRALVEADGDQAKAADVAMPRWMDAGLDKGRWGTQDGLEVVVALGLAVLHFMALVEGGQASSDAATECTAQVVATLLGSWPNEVME